MKDFLLLLLAEDGDPRGREARHRYAEGAAVHVVDLCFKTRTLAKGGITPVEQPLNNC